MSLADTGKVGLRGSKRARRNCYRGQGQGKYTHVLPTCSHTIQKARSNQMSRDQFGRLGVFWSQKSDCNKDPCEKAQLEQPHLGGSHQVLRKRPAQA